MTKSDHTESPVSDSSAVARRQPGNVKRPIRSFTVMSAVGMLVAAVALPAYTGPAPANASSTLEAFTNEYAQSIVVASELSPVELERATYLATTQKELDKMAAQATAASRFNNAAYLASLLANSKYPMTSPESGEVVYPLPKGSYKIWREAYRGHDGVDMTAAFGVPIYAVTSGTVRVSQDYHGGYGSYVVVDGVVDGKPVSTLYAHMLLGSRKVKAGQTVEAGQTLGHVGSTGRSGGPHLHLEVRIKGSLTQPLTWLKLNAG